jgi:hypothetical protein
MGTVALWQTIDLSTTVAENKTAKRFDMIQSKGQCTVYGRVELQTIANRMTGNK